ncbi:3-hydroxybutyrate oligomer hydrolase family protein [Janthinobacterium sp. YR213]|uniref:3-hydroxybutyrate oligomer hydrolase family protein n=1 Tax=Janthinobacterium sp. YR213 TaxID=1881027 RepID=UPI0008842674|nr:3-hydroxybutyrate oligomer hydrolase family protein [Janthinobacterium sp. YR213]SDH45280.1 hydroxybutyrate-dimer hydrolase [Janthinobacterium sp. YR213]
MQTTITRAGSSLCTLLALAACGSNHAPEELNQMPAYLGTITRADYDGKTNDLLTAGLGKTGLAGAAPAYANVEQPTPLELRRNAIYANYRAVLDIAANSGYGTLYGPNVDASGNVGTGEGLVAGSEYIAYADDGSGKKNVTLMVQVPASFDPDHACIVTGTSSGSRGIYGAIGSSGEWGLKKGCAVAYADKGSGTGLYVFEDDSVNLQNGVRAGRVAAGKNALFAPDLSDADRLVWAGANPNRIAFKHAHSQQNPEKDWGKVTLQSVEMAYYVLNERYGVLARDGSARIVRLTPKNTITIASSISNGAGSALLAAEQDTKGLISGVAASEPQIQPAASSAYSVRQGGAVVANPGRALFDYATYAALYQPCIASVAGNAGRCTALVSKGLLNGADLAAQQADAKQRLRAYGWLLDSDPLQAAHAGTNILVAVTYAYAYGKFSVTDKVCGFTFAQTDLNGNPVAFTSAQKAASFAAQNGILGNVVYENSVGGARVYTAGVSSSSGLADQSLDGFLCLRSLATGRDTVSGANLQGTLAGQSVRVRAGMAEVAASGKLNGKPAIIVHGRSDTLIPVNHASRAYLGLNAAGEGSNSRLRYIEVTNANHFDSFSSALPTLIVPLHVYLNRALDAMYVHLNAKQALPPSQVVRTVTRADASTLITNVNVPAIATAPAPGNVISVTGTVVDIPN